MKGRPGSGLAVVGLSDATYLQLFTVFSLLGLIGKAGVPWKLESYLNLLMLESEFLGCQCVTIVVLCKTLTGLLYS